MNLRAEVAQSKAVSPAPRTMTVPDSFGSCVLHEHMPDLEALATWDQCYDFSNIIA
jgi:hypothetical protein